MRKQLASLASLVLLAGATQVVHAEEALYVNYAPDLRYSANGLDSRIAVLPDKGLYGFGHDFGKLAACADAAENCLVLDHMALLELAEDVAAGAVYKVGAFEFRVVRLTEVSFAGLQRQAYRLDVSKNGIPSNSYLHDSELGVVAIITRNFGNREIPESIFLLRGSAGIFASCVREACP